MPYNILNLNPTCDLMYFDLLPVHIYIPCVGFAWFQPNDKVYESFSVFCPCEELEHLKLLEEEDMLVDWSEPIYLNFTHRLIMDQIEAFYADRGTMEKVSGDVYMCSNPPDDQDIIEWVCWVPATPISTMRV